MRDNKERYLDVDDLRWVFGKLLSLNYLSVTSSAYPFSDIKSDFKPRWDKMLAAETGPLKPAYPYLDSTIARRRYQNVVLGLEDINKSASLSFEYLPIDCFLDLSTNVDPPGYDRWGAGSSGIIPYDGKFFNKICRNMTGFQHLKMGLGGFSKVNYIDSTQPEYYTQVDFLLPRALAHFVGSFRDLRSLDISWNIEDSKSIPWHKITFEQKWRLKFFENTWPCLKDLKLQGIGGSYDQLLAFLRKHQLTLKRVSLKHPNMLMNGGQSYRQLFSTIRETYDFEKFEFLLETEKGRIYDENWATPLDDTFSRTAFWLEQFVTKATDIWPMKHDNPCWENWWHLATAFRE